MAKNLYPFCCCSSCSGLLSPSQQQQQPISSPQQSSQQQQQQPISSPPHQQSIAAHSPTSSPSQPSQQEPTATMTDFKNFLQKFNDISQIDTLISFLEELVEIASGDKNSGGSNSAVASHIQDGQRILDMLDTRFGKRPATKNSGNSTIAEIKKVCIEGLKSSEKIPKVGMALSILGSVLERFIKMSENKSECLDVLRRMLNLGKQIVQLNEQIPKEKEKLNEGVQYIIEGTFMCISLLAKANFFGFLTATVNADSLKAFQQKIDCLYPDMQLSTAIHIAERVTEIGNRVPKIASESQKIYAYQPTVGIEGAQECVIKLLDLNAQDAKSIVVVVCGFGGIGKTTLADAVYAQLNLQSYRKCRIHMDQVCTSNDLKTLQEQILYDLFSENRKLRNCDEGQGRLSSFFKESHYKPLFLYIDNGLKSRDLEQLLPKALDSCLPPKSRILITTRNLGETDKLVSKGIQRRRYDVEPLPETKARNLLLKKVSDYNDEDNIDNLLKLCGGVPLLLELAGSQLAINTGDTKNIVLEMLREGDKVEEDDISDRMVDFVYGRLLPPIQQAFLDIASFFSNYLGEDVAQMVGREEFRALEAASFVKTAEDGRVIVHDIVRARGKKLSEQEGNIITDSKTLLECLNNDEELKKIKGIVYNRSSAQSPIELNCHHLNCMSNSLEVLGYIGSEILFREKCQKPFKQLRYLSINGDVPDLPMELEKLEHLVYYRGPMTQGMNFYEFPPSLRCCVFNRYYSPQNRVAYSKIRPKVTPASSLVELEFHWCKNMQRLPDGLEKLTKLERLTLWRCDELRELPSKLGDLSNLKVLRLHTPQLKELPSNFGQLTNLQEFELFSSGMAELPSDIGQLQNLRKLRLNNCNHLRELPSNFGQLTNLEELSLSRTWGLAELPSYIGQLQNLRKLYLCRCCKEKELPFNFGQLTNLEELDLSSCFELAELPSDIGQLQNLRMLNLGFCSKLEEWPPSFADLTKMKEIDLTYCSSNLKHSLPKNIKGNNCTILE